MAARQDGDAIVRVEIRSGRFVNLGRDPCACEAVMPVRFLADGTPLIGGENTDPGAARAKAE